MAINRNSNCRLVLDSCCDLPRQVLDGAGIEFLEPSLKALHRVVEEECAPLGDEIVACGARFVLQHGE